MKYKIVNVCQFDDSAIYVNGRLLYGGNNMLVNGAIGAFERTQLKVTYKSIKGDIWRTPLKGWPERLSSIPKGMFV
jgi:hypothetical protein